MNIRSLTSFRFYFIAVVLFSAFADLRMASGAGSGSISDSTEGASLVLADSPSKGNMVLFDGRTVAPILIDAKVDAAVTRAAGDLAQDFARVTGVRPTMTETTNKGTCIIVGTLGQSEIVDRLAAEGKLDIKGVSGQWESYILQVVSQPLPGVERALVIVGSDRRGTIYGIYQLSAMIGVSPWYWWADVPVSKKKMIALSGDLIKQGPPGVKYRGIFINDEDWGLNPWASKTFDPQFGNVGPKTYAKVFELMLRLRLNYLWPAMHTCSTSFGSVPANADLADKFGIVIGSSHCESMLYNNIHWDSKKQGHWNYSLNRDAIHDVWEKTAQERGRYEAVWTLGIRGIHDAPMERPPEDMPGKINLMGQIFQDQRQLLNEYVTNKWGSVAQCFIPYKEVLPIYDAGLKVPDDVTLVWVDDNFGYIRRLSNPAERQRSGGSGVYWHLSYLGFPHSYTWINSTAPALMWEELHKAWENEARTLWIVNVGDIKPAEIGIEYLSKLAWNPDGFTSAEQSAFLHGFAEFNFGSRLAQPVTDLLMDFYRLGTVRKPELMERKWAVSLTPERAAQLEQDYRHLLASEKSVFDSMPKDKRDAYTEMVGFPARVLADTGLIFMADRKVQQGNNVTANEGEITRLRNELKEQVDNYNTKVAGGKWNHIMPGIMTAKNTGAWNSQVRWPWAEPKSSDTTKSDPDASPAGEHWRDAATAERQTSSGAAKWAAVEGLGASGRAMALEPTGLKSSWSQDDMKAPTLAFDFTCSGGDSEAQINFLPTFRIYPGLKLRVVVTVDDQAPTLVEVPGSDGLENERGPVRSSAVQNNYVKVRIPLAHLDKGKHTLTIRAVDPGAVVDAVLLP